MTSTLQCTLSAPEGTVFKGDAAAVIVPASDGELGILPRHAALIAKLGSGELRVTPAVKGQVLRFFIDGGFVQVLENRVSVLTFGAESLDKLPKGDAEEHLRGVIEERPPAGATLEEREKYTARVRVAKLRAKLARG